MASFGSLLQFSKACDFDFVTLCLDLPSEIWCRMRAPEEDSDERGCENSVLALSTFFSSLWGFLILEFLLVGAPRAQIEYRWDDS